jgi:uncharacterized membrane protein
VSRSWNDLDIARYVSAILRGGLLMSAVITALGGVLYLMRHSGDTVAYGTFVGEPPQLRSVVGIAQGAAHGDAPAIIQFGLLLLIATPIARVALALVGFYLERDRRYVAISAVVLIILVLSLLGRV